MTGRKLFHVTNGNGGYWVGDDAEDPKSGLFVGTAEGADTWNDRAAAEVFARSVGGQVAAVPEPEPTHYVPHRAGGSKSVFYVEGNGRFWYDGDGGGEEGDPNYCPPQWVPDIRGATGYYDRKDAEAVVKAKGGRVMSEAEVMAEALVKPEPKKGHVPAAELGLPPWRYVCVGDSDGERVGYDHFVYDAAGEEMMTAPNERVGMAAAAAPKLLEALVWLMDATTPAEGVALPDELKHARQRGIEAVRLAAGTPKLTPTTPPAETATVSELFTVWEQAKTEEEDARKVRDFFQSVYAQRNEKARRVAELIAGKILAEHADHVASRRAVWATIRGRLFLVRREGNDRDGWRDILDEQETPATY